MTDVLRTFADFVSFLRLQISIVSQEPVLFAESILYNICFGMPRGTEGVSREQARASTDRCCSGHMSTSLPSLPQNGYHVAMLIWIKPDPRGPAKNNSLLATEHGSGASLTL